MSRNALLVLGVLLVGSAAWLVDAQQLSPRAALHASEARHVDALLASRLALEVSVLEARAGLQSSFDPVNRALRSLREAAGAAEALRARGGVYAGAAEHVALAARALTSEEAALEQFKTDLTLLRLSSRHFPLAVEALTRRAEADVPRRQRSLLAGQLATLADFRTAMERYEQLPAHESRQRLERGLSELETVGASLDDRAREELNVLSGHARAVLDRRARVDRFARLLVRSPVRAHLEAARAELERGARRHAHSVGALQVLSAVLALAGVGVLASVVLRGARRAAR